ncbi:MAG TPA: hypothetical protein VIK54_06875 [Acidimicrobiia bacterium]
MTDPAAVGTNSDDIAEIGDTDPTVDQSSATPSVISRNAYRYALTSMSVTLATIVPLFRQTDNRSWRTVWAEDGYIYFEQAKQHGALAVLFRGYAGYLQLPPRLLGALSTTIPIRSLSIYYAFSATFVGALLAWFTYSFSDGWIHSRPVRFALASLVVLMPALGFENTANATDLIWVFVAVAPWALISLSERPLDIVIRAVVAFLAATATPLTVLFLPLAIGYAFIRKTRATLIVTAIFCLGIVTQLLVVLHTTSAPRVPPPTWPLLKASAVRVFAMFLIGDKGTSWAWNDHQGLLIVASTVGVAAIFATLIPGAGRAARILAAVLGASSVMAFILPARQRGLTNLLLGLTNAYHPEFLRFSVVPVMLLASAVAVLVAPKARAASGRIASAARVAFVAQVAVLTLVGFSVTNYRSTMYSWTGSLTRTYDKKCLNQRLDKVVKIQTDPLGYWPVTLPCRDIAP